MCFTNYVEGDSEDWSESEDCCASVGVKEEGSVTLAEAKEVRSEPIKKSWASIAKKNV